MIYKYDLKFRIEDRKYRRFEWERISIRATTRYSAIMKLLDFLADNNLVPANITIKLSKDEMETTTRIG